MDPQPHSWQAIEAVRHLSAIGDIAPFKELVRGVNSLVIPFVAAPDVVYNAGSPELAAYLSRNGVFRRTCAPTSQQLDALKQVSKSAHSELTQWIENNPPRG